MKQVSGPREAKPPTEACRRLIGGQLAISSRRRSKSAACWGRARGGELCRTVPA